MSVADAGTDRNQAGLSSGDPETTSNGPSGRQPMPHDEHGQRQERRRPRPRSHTLPPTRPGQSIRTTASRSRRSGLHAQRSDTSRPSAAVHGAPGPAPRPPTCDAAAPPSLHHGAPLPRACRFRPGPPRPSRAATGAGHPKPPGHRRSSRGDQDRRPQRDHRAKGMSGRPPPEATASPGPPPRPPRAGEPPGPNGSRSDRIWAARRPRDATRS